MNKILSLGILLIISTLTNAQDLRHKIRIINNNLFIEVYVNKKGPYNFIFDTGASGLCRIDKRVAEELHLPIVDSIKNTDGTGNYHIEPVVKMKTLKFGQMTLKNVESMMRDYNKYIKQGEIRIDGIIGRDFFYDYLLVLDCPNNTLTLSKDSLRVSSKNVIRYEKAFHIKGRVSDIDTIFNFDTGSVLCMHFPKSIIEN